MAAGLASTTSYLYDTALYDPDHSYIRTLIGKATAIAFATVCTSFVAKSLEGRANISWEAAGKLAGVEFILAAVISFATGESAVQKEHRHYNEYLYSWIKLSEEERTEKALKFMEAGLPAIIFGDLEKDKFPDPQTDKAWKALTPSQLSWTAVARESDLNAETKVFLYELMQKSGIESLRFQINGDVVRCFRGEQEKIDLLYQDMIRNPQFFYAHDEAGQKAMAEELFQGKSPVSPVDPKLKPLQITRMDGLLGFIWGKSLESSWGDVPVETRSAYVKRFWIMMDDVKEEMFAGVDISWLAEFSVEEIQALDGKPLTACHKVMHVNQEVVKKQISVEQLEAFNGCFRAASLREVE